MIILICRKPYYKIIRKWMVLSAYLLWKVVCDIVILSGNEKDGDVEMKIKYLLSDVLEKWDLIFNEDSNATREILSVIL